MGLTKRLLRAMGLNRDPETQPSVLTDLRPPLPAPSTAPTSNIPSRAKELDPQYSIAWDATQVVTDFHPSRPVTFHTLREVGRIPAISAIIRTRVNQVAEFSRIAKKQGDLGFVIEPDDALLIIDEATQVKCREIAKWVLSCGDPACGHGEDFETFLRRITPDSLELDQGCFEVRMTYGGEIAGFQSVDAATIRFAAPDSQERRALQLREDMEEEGQVIQVMDGRVVAQWPRALLAVGIRNPRTDVHSRGYGDPELYTLVSVLSWMVDAEIYNAASFKNGSHAKGILALKSKMPKKMFLELRRQYYQMMNGPKNAHKTMLMQLDPSKGTDEELQYLNMARSNQEMEFAQWLGYLQKLTAAVFQMDPAEINFVYGSENQSGGLQQSSGASRVEYSREKGLRPLLRAIESWLNKWVIGKKFPGFSLKFVGLDYDSERKRIEDLLKQTKVLTTNEIRLRMGQTPITKDMEENAAFADLPADAQYIHGIVSHRAAMFTQQMALSGYDANGRIHPDPKGRLDVPDAQRTAEPDEDSEGDGTGDSDDAGEQLLYYGPKGGAYLDPEHKISAGRRLREQGEDGGSSDD